MYTNEFSYSLSNYNNLVRKLTWPEKCQELARTIASMSGHFPILNFSTGYSYRPILISISTGCSYGPVCVLLQDICAGL